MEMRVKQSKKDILPAEREQCLPKAPASWEHHTRVHGFHRFLSTVIWDEWEGSVPRHLLTLGPIPVH